MSDDDDTPIRTPRNRRFPVWVLVLIAAVGLPVMAVAGVTAVYVALKVTKGAGLVQKVWTEEELSPQVKGKRAGEVIQLLGKPYFTSGDPEKDHRVVFRYADRLHNPYKTAVDDIVVVFIGGVATGEVR